MASTLFQYRYINESKRWGLFAKEQIETGTSIFRELAIILDASKIQSLVKLWRKIDTEEVSLHEDTRCDLESQTQSILQGMQDLKEGVKNYSHYRLPMEIHKKRMAANDIHMLEDGTDVAVPAFPNLPMELYKRTVTTTEKGSDEGATTTLQEPLQQINLFLQGVVQMLSPDLHAWGPITALINHGCLPNAVVSCYGLPDPNGLVLCHIGGLVLYAATTIEKGQEITIEYTPTYGTLEQRRKTLRQFGIAKCHCATCDHEESLIQRSEEDIAAKYTLQGLNDVNSRVLRFFGYSASVAASYPPVAFYRAVYNHLDNIYRINYHGSGVITTYDLLIRYAQQANDNIRVFWFVVQTLGYMTSAYGENNPTHLPLYLHWHQAALAGTIWNESSMDTLTLVPFRFICRAEQADLIFMLNHPAPSTTYHQLAVDPDGRLEEAAAATARATAAAASAAASAAKKDKAKAKKKAQKERKRVAAAEAERQEEEKEERLAARVAAVRAATVVPALPLPRPLPRPPPRPPSPPPHHRRFRSPSCPEMATVARFLAGVPLRPAPEEFGDTVSEGGLELRFGVRV